MSMIIDYELRNLLDSKPGRILINELNSNLPNEKTITIFPAQTNKCLSDAFANHSLWQDSHEFYQKAIDNCYCNEETALLDLLAERGIISIVKDYGEDGGNFSVNITINKINEIKPMLSWVKNYKYVITHGVLSLNTLTGDSYCLDQHHLFKPGSGYYDLFKEFLSRKNHFLNYEEIYYIQQQEFKRANGKLAKAEYVYDERNNARLKDNADECLKYLKRQLKMNDGLGELFKTYEKRGYILFPDQI